MKIRLNIFILIIALILIVSTFVPVFAEDINKEETILELNLENKETEKEKRNSIFEEAEGPFDPGLPEVTIDDATNWIERKGFEIITLMQKFMQPFAIVIFIGSAIMALVGVFGKGKTVSKGLVGMFLALIIYAVGLYAPEIMDIFLSWVRS